MNLKKFVFLPLVLWVAAGPVWAEADASDSEHYDSVAPKATAADRDDIVNLIRLAKSAVQDHNIPPR